MATRPDEVKVGEKEVTVLCHVPGLSVDDTIVNIIPEEKLMVVNYSYVRQTSTGKTVGGEVTGGFHTVELPADVRNDFKLSYSDDVLKVVIARQ